MSDRAAGPEFNEQTRCPKCGAGIGDNLIQYGPEYFECGTRIVSFLTDAEQSDRCRIAELERELSAAKETIRRWERLFMLAAMRKRLRVECDDAGSWLVVDSIFGVLSAHASPFDALAAIEAREQKGAGT